MSILIGTMSHDMARSSGRNKVTSSISCPKNQLRIGLCEDVSLENLVHDKIFRKRLVTNYTLSVSVLEFKFAVFPSHIIT